MRLSLLVIIALLAACEETPSGTAPSGDAHSPSDVEPSNGGDAFEARGQDPCETTSATYETVGEPFMRTWCTPCHHSELVGDDRPLGSEGVNLDTYSLVIEHLDRIEVRALGDNPTMPPAGGPSPEDLERLAFWLECGAIEHLNQEPSSP